MTTETDLSAYLAAKGLQVHRAAGAEVTIHCPWCPDGDPKGKGKLYLNTESWLYSCKRCDAAGNRKTLLEHFGDPDEVKTVGADPMLRRKILGEVAQLAHEFLIANKKKYQYLLDRGLTDEVIRKHKLGYVPKNVGISEMIPMRDELKGYVALVEAGIVSPSGREFLNDCITIPYFSHGSVVQIRAKFVDGKYLTAGGDHVRLYNSDTLFGADRVLITEGELDALAVESAIERAPASERPFTEGLAIVGLPGAGSWPDGLVQMLDGPTKVFVGLDPDETGEKFSKKLCDEIGQRARQVLLPTNEPKCDWTDYLLPLTDGKIHSGHTWADVRNLLVEADLAGKQMFSIVDIATKWDRAQSERPGLKLGWPSLDAVIRPGLKPGQVMVPLAMTGTGKTVWLSNVAVNLRAKHVLYVSLEMTATEVFEHFRRIHRFHEPQADRDQLLHDLRHVAVTERNRIGRGDLGDLIHEYQDTWGASPDLLIVDYLQYYARGFRGGSMYDRVSDAIMEVKAVSKEESVPTIIPSQVNRGAERGKPLLLSDARDAGTIEETADFIPSLYRPDQLQTRDESEPLVQTGAFSVQWLKSRHGGAGRVCNLKLSNLSLAIVDATFDSKNGIRVEQENSLYRQGVHYAEYRQRLDDAIAQGALV